MAMSKAGMSSAIKDKLNDLFTIQDDDVLTDFCDQLADALVSYITANAVVTVTSVSGVTTGAGTSGPGSGTIS